jgi:hypothetical protein
LSLALRSLAPFTSPGRLFACTFEAARRAVATAFVRPFAGIAGFEGSFIAMRGAAAGRPLAAFAGFLETARRPPFSLAVRAEFLRAQCGIGWRAFAAS